MRASLRPGIYRDAEDNLVTLARTASGYTVTHADGTVTAIGGVS